MIVVPQPFVVREECEKVAFQNGFRRALGENQGWAAFASTTARGTIHLAAASIHGPWILALDHAGIIAELGLPATAMPGPGKARFTFNTLGELYAALSRAYALGISLPDAPLREFENRVAGLPRTTDRPGHFSRPADGLLAGPLSPDRHHRPGSAACFTHHPMGGMRERRRTPRRSQRPSPFGALGRRIRPRARDLRRRRKSPVLVVAQRASARRTPLELPHSSDR